MYMYYLTKNKSNGGNIKEFWSVTFQVDKKKMFLVVTPASITDF